MSILIKGMDMPDDRPIIISIFPNGRVDTMEAKYFDSVLSAVEVPTPHGDLIDRDALIKQWEKEEKELGLVFGVALIGAMNEMKEFPIVIESEE